MTDPANISRKDFDGGYLIWRKLPRGFSSSVGGKHIPRYRHQTLDSAETEARRLTELFPESTFVILREIATVKVRQPEIA